MTFEPQDPSDPDPRVGQKLGEYFIVARVADGAMGRVYEGRHPTTRAQVAIKILHAEVGRDAVAVERFKREYETAEMLAHPHIVKVLELGLTRDGANYMVMEYLRGEELGNLLRREGAIRPARAIRLTCQAALALDHAHSFGVIHRDLKPDNIFLCASPAGDDVRLLDFGSVKLQVETGPKLTAFGTTLGSPYYMSPEQAMGKADVDHRTDVFAMSAILHECATGKVAFEAPNVAQILMKIVQYEPPPPSTLNAGFPLSFDEVVEHGLQKSKTNRTNSMKELARELAMAFGLSGEVERWAETPIADIEAALTGAKVPEPKPFAPRVETPVLNFLSEPPPPQPRGPSMLAKVLIAAAVLGAIVTTFMLAR
jgi:serine/threonine protein kinase